MKSVLLIDDESKIRNHLRASVPWREWGFRVAGEASNGEDALLQCERLRPDIALIDITMPVMDGLELLSRLNRQYPSIRSVILTAHRDFHYARQAVQLGASGYLLKTPLDLDELRAVLNRAGDDVDKERTAQQSQLTRQQMLKTYHYPMRHKFFEQLLTGLHATDDEIVRQAGVIGIHLPFISYSMLVCRMDELVAEDSRYPSKDRPLVEFSTLELVREALEEAAVGRYELFPIVYGQFVVLFDGGRTSAADIRSSLVHISRIMAEPLRKYMNIRLTVLVGECYGQVRQTRAVYAAVRSKLPALYYTSSHCPAFANELPIIGAMPKPEWERLESLWKEHVLESAALRAEDWLAEAEIRLRRYKPHPELLASWLLTQISKAESSWGQTNAAPRASSGTDGGIPPFAAGTTRLIDTLQAVSRWSGAWARRLAASIEVRPEIAACLTFIQERLHEDLTVDVIAKQAQLSSSYLSHLFKKEVGIPLSDYILEKRLDQAKAYLVSGQYLNYELIEKIGFRSYSYFCSVFKKSTGMTPNEYKRTHKPSVSL